jgi:hypothetical protein|tara:strand:- start:4458 stop:4736 length:279 start_codon:yes stop_codon:yes gene_type:complete
MKKPHPRKSVNYTKALKTAIHDGDFEGIISNIMLLGVKHNSEHNWQMNPRTFMELCTVLLKFRQEFGSSNDMDELFKVLDGGKSDDDESAAK